MDCNKSKTTSFSAYCRQYRIPLFIAISLGSVPFGCTNIKCDVQYSAITMSPGQFTKNGPFECKFHLLIIDKPCMPCDKTHAHFYFYSTTLSHGD
jgi:hypothetical protein